MVSERLYSIGEVSKLCNISRKTLRYYEKLGLITPDDKGSNNYRYYSRKTIMVIPVIKYYKMMGFTLDEMKDLVAGCDYSTMLSHFYKKVKDFEQQEEELAQQKKFVSDWYELISEANHVRSVPEQMVSLQYKNTRELLSMPYFFNHDYLEATINVDFTNHVESLKLKITGPVMMVLPREEGGSILRNGDVTIVQQSVLSVPREHCYTLKEGLYACCYHVGSLYHIEDTYQKIEGWAAEQGYSLGDFALERYITDYWTTPDENYHVSEVWMPVLGSSHQASPAREA